MKKLRIVAGKAEDIEIRWQPPGGMDAVTFWARPLGTDETLAIEEARSGVGPPAARKRGIMLALVDLAVAQVTRWDGPVGVDDEPLACDEAARRSLFVSYYEAAERVARELLPRPEVARGEASGGGSGSGGSIAASTAEGAGRPKLVPAPTAGAATG